MLPGGVDGLDTKYWVPTLAGSFGQIGTRSLQQQDGPTHELSCSKVPFLQKTTLIHHIDWGTCAPDYGQPTHTDSRLIASALGFSRRLSLSPLYLILRSLPAREPSSHSTGNQTAPKRPVCSPYIQSTNSLSLPFKSPIFSRQKEHSNQKAAQIVITRIKSSRKGKDGEDKLTYKRGRIDGDGNRRKRQKKVDKVESTQDDETKRLDIQAPLTPPTHDSLGLTHSAQRGRNANRQQPVTGYHSGNARGQGFYQTIRRSESQRRSSSRNRATAAQRQPCPRPKKQPKISIFAAYRLGRRCSYLV